MIHVVLLRAVNVGGTGKLPMAELKALCEGCGFAGVRTYIASGNVVLSSPAAPAQVKAALEAALARHAGKPVGVVVRSAEELARALDANPFAHAAPNRAVIVFLDAPPPPDTLARLSHLAGEEVALGEREIYVHYGDGMRDSKLRIPAAQAGTARNLNTVGALLRMAREAEEPGGVPGDGTGRPVPATDFPSARRIPIMRPRSPKR